jgi:hypothetical protein
MISKASEQLPKLTTADVWRPESGRAGTVGSQATDGLSTLKAASAHHADMGQGPLVFVLRPQAEVRLCSVDRLRSGERSRPYWAGLHCRPAMAC